ncbi:MAG: pentapeptide repeat-containing protein [Ilumatobacteraceae bacterium]
MSVQREKAVLIGRRIENREFVSLDLRGAVISDVFGRNIVLRSCDLSGATVSWCRFDSLVLIDCVLDGLVLENVVVTGALLADMAAVECHRVLVNGVMHDPDPEVVHSGAEWLLEQIEELFA